MVQCPRCGLQVSELHPVPADMLMKIQSMGESLPPQVCAGCLSDLKQMVSSNSGGVLIAQERAKEQHRMQLWKSRVSLIKKARLHMGQKAYSEAAISYEKYLKILSIVFDLKKGQLLTPQLFKESARTTELTVVTSVYWDLVRIYDSHDKYAERQQTAAKQLAVFVRFTPIYPDIIKKAESFAGKARNGHVIKQFLKAAAESRPRCFIATAAFEGPYAWEVQALRFYRDHSLRQTWGGRKFIRLYYRHSPKFASFLDRHPRLKPAVRAILRLMIKCVS